MKKYKQRAFARWGAFAVMAVSLCLSDCSTPDSIHEAADKTKEGDIKHLDAIDPSLNLARDDYRHIAAPKSTEGPLKLQIDKGMPPVPKLADILAAPRPPKIGETQLVSIAVTDDVPLKDVLLELAKLADVDIELDAGITGGIEFIAKDKPFNEVIDRICSLTGLRYTMKNNVLRVERDTPYIKSYSIDFLNLDRESDSSVNLSTNVLSTTVGGGGGGSGSALNTGSTSSVKSKSTGDFWKSLESGVQQILAYEAPDHISATTLQVEDANAVTAITGGQGSSTPAANGTSATGGAATAGKAGTTPPAPIAAPATSGANQNNAQNASKPTYTINRQAGILTLNATSSQHEMVERFLASLKKNASSQVLIEAKIIEVDLNDQYASGIDWQNVGTRLNQIPGIGVVTASFPLGAPANSIVSAGNFISFASSSTTTNILQLIEAFGTTRTLSSPRLHAINNQQSTLTFAENHVYFTLVVTPATQTTTGGVTTGAVAPTITSTTQTVPIGVMMTMMPSIDAKNNEITLAVRPTLSTIIDTVNDPAFDLTIAQAISTLLSGQNGTSSAATSLANTLSGLHNQIPEVQVRELDSTLKIKSGETMIIGGLMQQEAANKDQGVPFISSVPVIGNLFKSVAKSAHNKELVLLIKATIVNANGDLGEPDSTIFHKFSDDPRPVSF